jgi:hypothetical protein
MTKVRVKLFLTVEVDTEEYPVPADGDIGMELEDGIREYLHDVDGVEIRNIKSLTE